MSKRKREILALALLVLLGLGVGVAMAWYMMAGHSWNKAASHIDDLVGSMEGYTVIVYEGTLKPSRAASGPSASPASSEVANAGKSKGDGAARQSGEAGARASAGAASAASSSSSSSASKRADKQPLDIKRVVGSYREKGAGVITLHTGDLNRYDEPIVVSCNGKNYGICSAQGPYRYVVVRDKVRALKEAGADFTIVLADKPDIKKGWLRGVDMVVLACEGRIPASGQTIGSAFFVDAVKQGEAHAVIIAPSGTVTSKTVTEL